MDLQDPKILKQRHPPDLARLQLTAPLVELGHRLKPVRRQLQELEIAPQMALADHQIRKLHQLQEETIPRTARVAPNLRPPEEIQLEAQQIPNPHPLDRTQLEVHLLEVR